MRMRRGTRGERKNMNRDTQEAASGFTIGMIVLAIAIVVLTFVGVVTYRYSAVENTKTDNAVYHASAQYNDGMVQRLEQLQESYLEAVGNKNQAGMDGIASITRHEFAAFPEERLNPDLQEFLHQMKIHGQQGAR